MLTHKVKTLDNGLRLITAPMKGVESMTVMVAIGAGSRYETKETNGLSHFVEHMVFKGTKKRPTNFDITSAVDSIGGQINAATAKEFTIFFIKANATHQPLAFDVLSDLVLNAELNPKEIEMERGVITEEINMYDDMPQERVSEAFESLLYSPTSLGWYISGKKENIKAIQKQDFIDYQKRLYYPGNMVVVKAGKVEEDETLDLTEKYFGHLKAQKKEEFQPLVFTQKEPKVRLRAKKTSQSHFCLGVRAYAIDHPDCYVVSLLAAILGGSMSSRIMTEVREKRGLAYIVRTIFEDYIDNGYLMTQAGVDIGKIDEAIKVILNEYGRITCEKVSNEELAKGKELLKGRLILALEDSQNVAERYALQMLLENKLRDPQETIERIDKITAQDLQRVAKDIFHQEKLNLAVIGPYNDEERFLKLLR
jgi:predicted Zn-dependent peptidase